MTRLLIMIVAIIATWCGNFISSFLLEFILNLFGLAIFGITSTIISYSFFLFAIFGISGLLIRNSETQLSKFVLQTRVGISLAIFIAVAAIVSSASSTLIFTRVIEETYPNHPILLFIIALPYFVFVGYIIYKMDKGEKSS